MVGLNAPQWWSVPSFFRHGLPNGLKNSDGTNSIDSREPPTYIHCGILPPSTSGVDLWWLPWELEGGKFPKLVMNDVTDNGRIGVRGQSSQ